MNWKIAGLMLLAGSAVAADLPRSPSPADVELYFISPQDGATLAPGTHRLQLLLGDHLHLSHDPPVVSEPITITVR